MAKKEKKVVSKKDEKANDFFYRVEESVAKITGMIDTATGEVHRFTLSDKNIYSVMRHRYLAFKDANDKCVGAKKIEGKFYYDNQSDLAMRLGLDRKTVNTSIDKLTSIGVVKKYFQNTSRGNANNIKSLSYTVLDIFSVKGIKFFYDVLVGDVIERTFVVDGEEQAVVKVPNIPINKPVVGSAFDDEDENCPF